MFKEKSPSFILENKMPKNFLVFFNYVRNLSFEEKPNYDYLKQLLKQIATENKIDLNNTFYDWNVKICLIKNHP